MIGPSDLLNPSPAPHFKTFQVFLICCPKCPSHYWILKTMNGNFGTGCFWLIKGTAVVNTVMNVWVSK